MQAKYGSERYAYPSIMTSCKPLILLLCCVSLSLLCAHGKWQWFLKALSRTRCDVCQYLVSSMTPVPVISLSLAVLSHMNGRIFIWSASGAIFQKRCCTCTAAITAGDSDITALTGCHHDILLAVSATMHRYQSAAPVALVHG